MSAELDVKEWLEKSLRSIKAAEELLGGELFEESAFHSQQSIEKALKAVYISKLGKLRKIHDLALLGKSVNLPASLLEKCAKITSYYIETRYPSSGCVVSEAEAIEAIDTAKKVLVWAKKNV